MKKFCWLAVVIVLNCHAALASNPYNYYWWESATLKDVQQWIAKDPKYDKEIFLEFAVKANPDPKVIKLLLKEGANINTKNNSGETILIMAAMNSNPEIIKMFIKKGFDVNAKDGLGYTALIEATIHHSPEALKLLIDAGADVDAQTEFGDTALIHAAWNSNPEFVKRLIDAGANVNAKNKKGETALMSGCSPEVTRLLIKAGANVNAEDNEGNTVLYKAVYYGDPQVQKILKAAGAKGSIIGAKIKKFMYCHTGMRLLEPPRPCKLH